MKDINIKQLATIAKHMICPETLNFNHNKDLSSLGESDFKRYKFRHCSKNYKGDSNPNQLLSKTMLALSNNLTPDKEKIILLSDGKDSMALAVALSRLNIKCKTLTLLRDEDDEMKGYIEHTCSSLGHEPYFVTVSSIIETFDKQVFLSACKLMKHAVLDQGFIFFLFGLKKFFSDTKFNPVNFQFIDGLGNDEHLGYLPSKLQRYSYKLSKLGLWRLKPPSITELNWYLRSPAESHGDLSALACFFRLDDAYDLNLYFEKAQKGSDFIDFRAFSRGSFHDHQCMMEKTRVAAEYFGSTISFPWTDDELAEFCFNLPLNEKFDFPNTVNKLPLRKLLKEEINWQQEKRGVDLYFDLELNSFINEIAVGIAPDWAVKKVVENSFLADNVKKRALLELLNLSGFMISRGYTHIEIESLLGNNLKR